MREAIDKGSTKPSVDPGVLCAYKHQPGRSLPNERRPKVVVEMRCVYGFDGIMEETSRKSCSKVARQAGSGTQNPQATAAHSSLPHEKSTTTSARQGERTTHARHFPSHPTTACWI
jgi:hypothetical protein